MSEELMELLDFTITELHTPDAIYIIHDKPISEAIKMMQERNIGSLIVIDENVNLLGIVTERDVLMKCAGGAGDVSAPVNSIMTKDPMTIHSNESVVVALQEMTSGNFRHLPVTNMEGKPVGMLSIKDLLSFFSHHLKDKY